MKRSGLNLQNVGNQDINGFLKIILREKMPDVCHSLLEKMKDFTNKILRKVPCRVFSRIIKVLNYTRNAGVSLGMSKCLGTKKALDNLLAKVNLNTLHP